MNGSLFEPRLRDGDYIPRFLLTITSNGMTIPCLTTIIIPLKLCT